MENLHFHIENGNSCFRERRWDAAAVHYTKCIDAALLLLKKASSNHVNTCLLNAYSDRAETRIQMMEYELALEDSNQALQIDSSNLGAIYKKGRALFCLRDYAAACIYLEKADKPGPIQKEIQCAHRQAMALFFSTALLGLAPPMKVLDYIGPLEIKMTEDGRGRGLYATRDINSGRILLVSNAVALAYHKDSERNARRAAHQWGNIYQPSREDLVLAVVSAASKSQRLLQQLYSLDSNSSRARRLDVPAIDLFMTEGQMSLSLRAGKKKLEVDVGCVRDIIKWNSFGGDAQTFASKLKLSEAKLFERNQNFSWRKQNFSRLWLLPNSTRMAMGSAMFLHASKPIMRAEEITISYFDTLVPLLQRQAMCQNWAFQCNCRRCILEHSLKTALEPLAAQFEQLHDKAAEETDAARSQEPFDGNLPVRTEFAKIFVEAEEIIRSSELLKTEEERDWIRASFVSPYLAGKQPSYFYPTTLTRSVPSLLEVMMAIQKAVPGDFRSLTIAAFHYNQAVGITGHETVSVITQYALEQARDACIKVFGKRCEDVMKALILQLSKYYLF